ncbi:MAG TPA: MFS transporter [Acidimicrobiales bacterium]|nr:MFS transporter [Acidimicrobiales bacterium]
MRPPFARDEPGGTRRRWAWHVALGQRARRSPRYQWWVLWVVLSGLLATNLLFTVFVVALPEVARGLHTSVATITWVVTGPMLAFGVVAPLVGKASDLFGHRRIFLVGVGLEVVVAALSALSPSAGVLILARTLGGLVGASIGAASMALVLSVFDKGDRVKALGFWSLVGAGGPVIGVALGGPVIQLFGWRWIFVMQIPLLVASALLATAVLPERAAGRRHVAPGELHLDWAGAAAIATCVGSFLLALNRGPIWGWASPGIMVAFALSVAGALGFVAAERRAAEPVFPLHYLRRRNFVFPIVAQTFANFAYIGAFFLAPLLLEEVFGYAHDQSAVGFLSLPRPIVFSLIAPVAGYVSVRIGERTSAVIGTSAVVASMAVFAMAGHSTGLVLVEVAFVLSGVGLGVGQPPLSASVANEFAAEDLGTASASQQLMNQVGTVAGIQVMQTVQAAAERRSGPAGLLSSFHLAYLVGGAVALVGVAAASMTRSTERRRAAVVDATEALDMSERQPVLSTGTP